MAYRARPQTFLEELDQMPPYMCWVLARKPKRKPITQREIISATGWDKKKVTKFCGLKSWRGVTVEDADAFRSACGITRENERRHRAYLKRSLDPSRTLDGLSHVRKRPGKSQERLINIALSLQASEPADGAAGCAAQAA